LPDGKGLVVKPIRQAAALDQFQGQIRPAVVFPHLKDLHNVGMLQLGHHLRLGSKPADFPAAGMGAREDHFQGHVALQRQMPRPIDHAHAAMAQDLVNFITGDLELRRGPRPGCCLSVPRGRQRSESVRHTADGFKSLNPTTYRLGQLGTIPT
jgi:hypothetical protein